jgi:antitoxin StbD
MEHIYANLTASISEFKKSPTALLDKGSGEPIALLNHNKPTAYLIPARLYEKMLECLDDRYLLELARDRLKDKSEAIAVNLDEL